jgi:ribonuclease P protein component
LWTVNKRFRLKKSSDFQRVRRFGKAIAHPFVVLLHHPNDLDQIRVGVAAGKTVGKAVQRNRVKRVMRAAIQPLIERIKPGCDIVLIARPKIMNSNANQINEILFKLLKRAGLILE